MAEALRDGNASVRVLLVSSDATQVRADVLRRCGAVGFVAKTELAATDLAPYLDG